MWRGVIAGLAVVSAVPAFAADLPPRTAPPVYAPAAVPVPMYNWNGVYFGGHIGGAFDSETATNVTATPLATAGTQVKSSPSGFLGGVQLGANYQFGAWVVGIEGAGSWVDLKTTTNTASLVPGNNILGTSKLNTLVTLSGRLGYAANNWLFYALGGVAWEDVDYGTGLITSGTGPLGGSTVVAATTLSDTRTGWLVGGGLEWGFGPSWSAKVEYNYMDFGTQRYNFTLLGVTAPGDITSRVQVVKGALNYKLWGWGG